MQKREGKENSRAKRCVQPRKGPGSSDRWSKAMDGWMDETQQASNDGNDVCGI